MPVRDVRETNSYLSRIIIDLMPCHPDRLLVSRKRELKLHRSALAPIGLGNPLQANAPERDVGCPADVGVPDLDLVENHVTAHAILFAVLRHADLPVIGVRTQAVLVSFRHPGKTRAPLSTGLTHPSEVPRSAEGSRNWAPTPTAAPAALTPQASRIAITAVIASSCPPLIPCATPALRRLNTALLPDSPP